MSVLVVGESLVDVVTSVDGTTSEHPGGSPLNVAVALGRLGTPTQLVTALGDDARGTAVRAHLVASGVDALTSPLSSTSVAFAQLDVDGSAGYTFEVQWELTQPPSVTPSWVHVGSLGVVLEPGAQTVAALVAQHSQAVISYDPNCRPQLMGSRSRALATIEAQIRRSDVVKLSDEDARWLLPDESLDAVARRFLAHGPAVVVITSGEQGAAAWYEHGTVTVESASGDGPIVDTVGAGDAFMAGLIQSLIDRDVRALSEKSLRAALEFAASLARRCCERAGADPPWLAELSTP